RRRRTCRAERGASRESLWEPFEMALKIMCAGFSKDERPVIESGVRSALGERGSREAWTVSVVKFGSGWSVTLDGPFERRRGMSFMLAGPTGPDELANALRKAIDPSEAPAKPAPVAAVTAPVAAMSGPVAAMSAPAAAADSDGSHVAVSGVVKSG